MWLEYFTQTASLCDTLVLSPLMPQKVLITSGKVKQPYLSGPFYFIDVTLKQDCVTGLNWPTIHLTGECNLEERVLIGPVPHLTIPHGQEMVRHFDRHSHLCLCKLTHQTVRSARFNSTNACTYS